MSKLFIKYCFAYVFWVIIVIILSPILAYEHVSFEYKVEKRCKNDFKITKSN